MSGRDVRGRGSVKRRRAVALIAVAPMAAQAQGPVVVFAAASLKNALDEVASGWAPAPRISYAASSALARQIEQGAPADLFFSADLDWMDYLAARNLIQADSRVDLLGNRIVLIAPRDSAFTLELEPGVDLAPLIGDRRLAMANVDAVPAGKYGKAALQTLGAWEGVRNKVAQAENVRAALVLVARGEAPLGIVYGTDAAAEASVRVVAIFPKDSHPPIVFPAALTRRAKPEARGLLDHLTGATARAVFEKHGFTARTSP